MKCIEITSFSAVRNGKSDPWNHAETWAFKDGLFRFYTRINGNTMSNQYYKIEALDNDKNVIKSYKVKPKDGYKHVDELKELL